jgi:hypothetical protein
MTTPYAAAGSQRWIQVLVNECPSLLDDAVCEASRGRIATPIGWRSPLRRDGFEECRDGDFLRRLDLHLPNRQLLDFWPAGGPHWDALGRAADGAVILVEAKSHRSEAIDGACSAGETSRRQIERSLTEVKQHLGVDDRHDWLSRCYQLANRIAHLHLVRELNRQPAWLVYVAFTRDPHFPDAPADAAGWEEIRREMRETLGLRPEMVPHLVDVCLDVPEIAERTSVALATQRAGAARGAAPRAFGSSGRR